MATHQQSSVTLELRRTFAAPLERVFRAWTTPEELTRWHSPTNYLTPLAEVDLRVGGRYRVHMRAPDGAEHCVAGVYREVDPPRKLVYTWQWQTDPPSDESLVTVLFLDRGATTELVLRHERFPTPDARDRHEHGWIGCLAKLGDLF